MRKITGVFISAFVFLLGLLGIASAENVSGRSSGNRLKNTNLEMDQNQGKFQNLEGQNHRIKGENLEAGKSGQAHKTEALDAFLKIDDLETQQR
jgi:hypothetical protein